MSPHVSHRQYVDASTFSLAVVTFDDPQNGQAAGATRARASSSTTDGLFTFGCDGDRVLVDRLQQRLTTLAAQHLALPVFLKSCAIAISFRHLNLPFSVGL